MNFLMLAVKNTSTLPSVNSVNKITWEPKPWCHVLCFEQLLGTLENVGCFRMPPKKTLKWVGWGNRA